jgi:hypothetical protein
MAEDDPSHSDGLSLTAIDAQRSPEEKARNGKSGETMYQISYNKEKTQSATHRGKVTEIGRIDDNGPEELQSLVDEGYTHYAVFRLRDRSTTTVIQSTSNDLYKVFVLGRSNVRVSHPATIVESPTG